MVQYRRNRRTAREGRSMEHEDVRAATFLDAAIKHIAGREDPARTTVLDFGCGSGRLVDRLLALGYDAYGCDITRHWHQAAQHAPERLAAIAVAPYRLPFADRTFDVVVSTSVLEHAQNKAEVFREIHRVLKVGGYAMHLFPSRWYLPVEPHIYVPLVNFMWPRCPRWWLALWARLGIRNEFQGGRSWRDVTDLNAEYCARGLDYRSTREYRALSMRTFGNFATPMGFYVTHGYGGVASLLRKLPCRDLTGWVAGKLRMTFVVVQRQA
jgi:SAM-dependent methyltransferase